MASLVGRALTTHTYVEKAREVHGDRYDYSRVVYAGATSKITIGCPVHGWFEQATHSHLGGRGCWECSRKKRGKSSNTEEFIEKARIVHGDRYDYSGVVYEAATTKVELLCKEHGMFLQSPAGHLSGYGCPRCGRDSQTEKRRSSVEEFVEKARVVHGDYYSYHGVVYDNALSKVVIACPKHGDFSQTPANHLTGHGCPRCGGKYQSNTLEFIEKARNVHSDRYDYSDVEYEEATKEVEIICRIHGAFSQKPSGHLNGYGCPDCGKLEGIEKRKKTTDQFVVEARNVHKGKYTYEETEYQSAKLVVSITCPIHGTFSQLPNDHLDGHGCQKCGAIESKAERDIFDYVSSFVTGVERRTKAVIHPLELDIHIPEKKLAIEYCGIHWHTEAKGKSRNYHHRKHLMCEKLGIRLLTIFEDEWLTRRSLVMKLIENALGVSLRGPGAREFEIKQISSRTARSFCELHHVQGATQTAYAVGAYHEGVLRGVMTFGRPTRQSVHPVELRRFCTDGNYPGLGSRMFQSYVREHKPESVVSFSDNRLFSGGLYERLGFVRDGEVPPDYAYVRRGVRHNKSSFRTGRLRKMGFPQGTESEIMFGLGYDRIWDCGKTRWVWEKPA